MEQAARYREELPDGCPPPEAKPLTATRLLFRLVSRYPPTEQDFDSVWKEQPERRIRLDPCQGRGLSLFDTAAAAQRRTSYLTLRDKIVCAINVTPDAGPLLMTGRHHYTWWPLDGYDILAHAQIRGDGNA